MWKKFIWRKKDWINLSQMNNDWIGIKRWCAVSWCMNCDAWSTLLYTSISKWLVHNFTIRFNSEYDEILQFRITISNGQSKPDANADKEIRSERLCVHAMCTVYVVHNVVCTTLQRNMSIDSCFWFQWQTTEQMNDNGRTTNRARYKCWIPFALPIAYARLNALNNTEQPHGYIAQMAWQ